MICSECGQRLPDSAVYCTACGRRIAPVRLEPTLEPLRTQRAAASPPPRRAPALPSAKPREAPSYATRLSRAIAGWPLAPHAAVALGCALAVAIYWSAARDEAAAREAGAARLAAATGAMPTTSQAAAPEALQFSARQALQGLYGNYDPVLDGAYWTVTGAPERWGDWNGRRVLIRPLVSRSDDSVTRHVLVTHSVEIRDGMVVKQGAGCSSCKSLIGAALFVRDGALWKLASDQRFLGVEGAFGAPPHIAVSFPAKSGVELRIDPPSVAAPDEADEAAPAVVMSPGKKVKGTLTQQRRRSDPADSPFPTSASGP